VSKGLGEESFDFCHFVPFFSAIPSPHSIPLGKGDENYPIPVIPKAKLL
jgi:hypothetical protein